MTTDLHKSLSRAWADALASGEELWYEWLDRHEVADGVAFAYDQQSTSDLAGATLPDLLRQHLLPATRISDLGGMPPAMRLLIRTIEHLYDHIERVMEQAFDPRDLRQLPREGVVQYFGDDLRFSLCVTYRFGGAVELLQVLPIADPVLLVDPLHLIYQARTDAELDVARTTMFTHDKIVILRNILVHVERGAGVFGPSIDTLVVADWLIANRLAKYRLDSECAKYFRDPLSRTTTAEITESGRSVLEIGSGSGLILASVTRNEARLHRFDAIDKHLGSISTTYNNTFRQRQLHPGWIGDRGAYIVGEFSAARVTSKYDSVICNPPYVPRPPGVELPEDAFSAATIGTELLSDVVSSVGSLLRDDGELLLVLSAMSRSVMRSHLPPEFGARVLVSRAVPFQVESAKLEQHPDMLAFLRRVGLREGKAIDDGRTRYEHDVLLLQLKRKEQV